mmetsp:Transcript_33261/g.80759  ORF Transcript_33261/g.80759 Transcript_33261/m.80759 type:complete len:238 (+) Transcript_33261:356-1069(+)
MKGGEDRQRFFDRKDFPIVQDFEANFKKIQDELDYVMKNVRTPQFDAVVDGQAFLNKDQAWSVFQFRVYNQDLDFNAKYCPVTAGLIQAHPEISYAMFSILEGPKHIPPHEGLYSGVLRIHVPLRIPSDCNTPGIRCEIRVKNETRMWQEGECLVFDDSLEHEVHMQSEGIRAVLFLDIRRPLPFPQNVLNYLFLWYSRYIGVVQESVEKARAYTMSERNPSRRKNRKKRWRAAEKS